MDSYAIIDSIKRRKALLILVVLVGVVLFIVFRFTVINIAVDGNADGATDVSLINKAGDAKKGRTGINIVSRTPYTIRVSTNDKITEKSVNPKPLSTNNTTLRLQTQKNIRKVAANGQDCVFAKDLNKGPIYTYGCYYAGSVIRYSFEQKPIIVRQKINSLHSPKPYRQGLLGFTASSGLDDQLELSYFDGQQLRGLGYLVTAEATSQTYEILVSTDNSFIVADKSTGELAYFSSLESRKPKVIQTNDKDLHQFSINDNMLYATGANAAQDASGEGAGSHIDEFVDTTLDVFDVSGGDIVAKESVELSDGLDFFGAVALENDIFAVQRLDETIELFQLNGKSMKSVDDIEGGELTPDNGGFVFVRGNDYFQYKLSDNSSYLVYRMTDLTPVSIQNSSGSVIFSVLGAGNSLYNFVLEEADRASESNISGLLNIPTTNKSVDYIDISGETIYAKLLLTSFVSDHQTGEFTYDPDDFAAKKNVLVKELKNLGYSSPEYRFVIE